MPVLHPAQDFAFFCDESGISTDRFTVVGGLCLPKHNIPIVLENMAAYRKKFNMTKELKWSKITDNKFEEYKQLVDYFFAMNSTNKCHFHSIIFDNHKWRHNKFNDGDSDIGLSKLYYQLLHHKFCKKCAPRGTLYVRLDRRNSSTCLEDLRNMLNRAAARDHKIETSPFKVIEPADSKECDILQINDVILGAVCAVRNGKHLLETGRKSKKDIANMVLEKSGFSSFEKDSPISVHRFTIWNMRSR
ncbi:conserved hypothetical protein [Methylocella tundrae]|uniref:DUF3800 domain-containing protein n=1 Tax=Methylocella tundrae TaxID=227605 RepID=A0A8B6MCF9_METTU|nr:DUF3800 domain-containing protein [Methylocella tundrae]VTZ25760.1 conserved hypothetical protein [Methylocella tundrae]VTZ52624.1 conserved hypothetical protein [Methylocella tundrae]